MMLNIILILTINNYKPLQTHCTKLIAHLGSTLQKLAILKNEVHFFWRVDHNFVTVSKIL